MNPELALILVSPMLVALVVAIAVFVRSYRAGEL